MSDSPRIEELRAEARHARERHDLYRAKMYGMRPTSTSRLRELARIQKGAEARLRLAEQQPTHEKKTRSRTGPGGAREAHAEDRARHGS